MNSHADDLFVAPQFRDGVHVSFHPEYVDLSYKSQGAKVDVPADSSQAAQRLFQLLLEGGRTQQQIAEQCPLLAQQLDQLLRELDRLGLLTEGSKDTTGNGSTGYAFWCELQRFVSALDGRLVTSRLFNSMRRGEVSRRQMCGYVLEYYHVVHRSPGIIAPALTHVESVRTRRLLCDFLAAEMNHDEMIGEALFSVGFSADQLEFMTPLPATFGIISSLSVYAEQHPASFKAALFLLERPQPEFHQAFQMRCRELGMPDEFIEPVMRHSGINEDGAHDDISRLLLSELPYMSIEEQNVVKKHLFALLQTMVNLEEQILVYYGDERNPIPRCFG